MTAFLIILGIVVVVVASVFGLMSGDLARIDKDPEVQKQREEQERERKRQQAWKDKWK